MDKISIGVQPFTVHEAMSKDYVGSLERLANIGFRGVELGIPPEGMTIQEQKALLQRLEMQVIGTHGPFDNVDFDPNVYLDYLNEVDGKYLALSLYLNTKDEVLQKAEGMNRLGEICRNRGVQLLCHNHDWEFVKIDGEYALDIFLRETNPEYVKMEMDTYWVKRGGLDPAAYLSKLTNRCPVLHIKDMEPGEEQFFAEIGEGILNFSEIAIKAAEAGTEWLIVEQDESRRDPFESLEISYRNLQKLGLTP